MSKFMKIEVEAKLILTVPSIMHDEEAADIILAAEQHINQNGLMMMPPEKGESGPLSGTRVGIRLHTKGDYTTVR